MGDFLNIKKYLSNPFGLDGNILITIGIGILFYHFYTKSQEASKANAGFIPSLPVTHPINQGLHLGQRKRQAGIHPPHPDFPHGIDLISNEFARR